ncbi:TraB/GumN family protein [Pseudorhodobacter sp.]|uniref:TraB/GumN family protein n=1 Tax=Pseudorhodobacter sp. TaxID=1934400 RepID=UPI0026478231|nr:TraB/GumN family protein [Pseudorhodobacter sp.]MDN5788571.1 TraB/GumN family protein [Pseudorhodobacter sp.]
MRILSVCFLALNLLLATHAQAQCTGINLIETLPTAKRDALYAAAHAEPFATGNLWQATRGDQTLYLTGTFHLDDPRLDAAMTRLAPVLAQSKSLLVEAGPEEEAALQAQLASNPAQMMDMAGSGLETALAPAEWDKLKAAMLQRGIPSSITGKLRPWFVSMMLAIPPCALQTAAMAGGLDKRLMADAASRGLPIIALEPFDTALKLFDGLSLEEQITMIRNALQVEDQAGDFLATTADAYFAGESRLIWEYSHLIANEMPGATAEKTEADMAKAEGSLMTGRNREWIAKIEQALGDGPALAAFGALHLSGKEGVLALLEKRGFTITALPN